MAMNATILFTTGDVDSLEHGGGVVFQNHNDNGTLVWEWWHERENEGDAFQVYSIDIPDNVVEELDWADWKGIADFTGVTLKELKSLGADDNLNARVSVLEGAKSYHADENLDAYPLHLTEAELCERWPHLGLPSDD